MESTNDHFLKITGKVNIPVPLEVDCEYAFVGEISTYGCDTTSKQDGTHNHTHKAQFSSDVQLIKGEQVILGKRKSSNSAKWRRLIEGNGLDYDKWMQWQFSKFDEMREEYEARST
tara:strand:- start:1033 stop:1380 length:348 start_codon:yes stop_codon:yes gene_type:complete